MYYRCVGDPPHVFLSGGDASDPKKFNIRKKHDLGHENNCTMIKLPREGIVFCRGIGSDPINPTMACVLFDADGNIRDEYGYMGLIDRWNDIVH